MKKILAALLTAAMLLSVSACENENGGSGAGTNAPASTAPTSSAPASGAPDSSAPEGTSGGESGAIEGYPASLDEWTGQQFVDYFKSVGVFKDGGGEETWVQDHSYWAGTPVSECAGFWDEEGFKMVMIFVMKGDLADSSEDALNEAKSAMKEKKIYQPTEDWNPMNVDHLVGNVAFSFSDSIDEEFAEEMEKAYNELITKMGAAADF